MTGHPEGRPNGRPAAAAGFTLIELLVTVAVLAVLSVGVVLATGQRPGQDAGPDMARFQDEFATMQALAIEGRQVRGLGIGPEGMLRVTLGPEGWENGGAARDWRGTVAFLHADGLPEFGVPEIRFLPNGRTDAFSITFQGGARCESDGWTGLTCAGG